MSRRQDYTADVTTLAELAGVSASPAFFRIIDELLEMGVTPENIYHLLRRISGMPSRKEDVPGRSGPSKH